MPNSNNALIFLIKKGVINLSTNLIKIMGMLSCLTNFFVGNKLIVLNSALSSTGSRNIEKEAHQRKQ